MASYVSRFGPIPFSENEVEYPNEATKLTFFVIFLSIPKSIWLVTPIELTPNWPVILALSLICVNPETVNEFRVPTVCKLDCVTPVPSVLAFRTLIPLML